MAIQTSAKPYKVGDKVHHEGVAGIVIALDGEKVRVKRHFNCSAYWDDHDYWEPLTKHIKQIGGIAAIMADQGKDNVQ